MNNIELENKIKEFKSHAKNYVVVEDGVTHPAQVVFEQILKDKKFLYLKEKVRTEEEIICLLTCIGRADKNLYDLYEKEDALNYIENKLYDFSWSKSVKNIDVCIGALENFNDIESVVILKKYINSQYFENVPFWIKKYSYNVLKDICDEYSEFCTTAIQKIKKENDDVMLKNKKFKVTARFQVDENKINVKSLHEAVQRYNEKMSGKTERYGTAYDIPDYNSFIFLKNISHKIVSDLKVVENTKIEVEIEVNGNYPFGKTLLNAMEIYTDNVEFIVRSLGTISENQIKIDEIITIDWKLKKS